MAIDLRDLVKGKEMQWIAFDADYTKVVSHHESLLVTRERAIAAGYEKGDVVFFFYHGPELII